MSVHLVPGQDDITLAIGAGGDKTITIPVTGTHVQILNEDTAQHILFTLNPAATFPADWERLDRTENVMVPTGGSTDLYLRKKTYIRGVNATHDVPVRVQVGETDQAV